MNSLYVNWIPQVLALAQKASEAILDIYQKKDYQIQNKQDLSPVTVADLLSHQIILSGLADIDNSLPVISEEGPAIPYEIRAKWPRFWLVDPLDGTRDFIKGTGEFSVNIALVEGHTPVLGVVAVPLKNHFYWSVKGGQAYFQDSSGAVHPIQSQKKLRFPIRMAMSRYSKEKKGWSQLLQRLKHYEILYTSSSVKMCLIAQGDIDLYPRFGATGEWDTAAPQCILTSAGGHVVDLSGNTLEYNRHDTLDNPSFYAVSCVELLSYIVDNSDLFLGF